MSVSEIQDVLALTQALRSQLTDAAVITDEAQLALMSCDVYSTGQTVALAIAPQQREQVGPAIKLITSAGFAVYPRGGGMSYTGGYLADHARAVVVDLSHLNNIVEINADDMTITVEAGVTWAQIYAALMPLDLRLPFFGTFSGTRATVGGGMSNGALFMGTARYGTGAEIVIGMDVVTADGETIRTGQAGFRNGRACFRSYGPDLTGLFVHDAGALGIKTLVSLRMIRKPAHEGFASYVVKDALSAAALLSDIARTGRVEEVYVFDPETTRRTLDPASLKSDLKRLLNVVKNEGGVARGLKAGLSLVGAGRSFVGDNLYSVHLVCADADRAGVDRDLAACAQIAQQHGAGEIANSMPKAARANPFEPVNSILGSQGDRWAALNSKVAHSDAAALIEATQNLLSSYSQQMQQYGVVCSSLCIAISNHVFSYEPVLRWHDEWLPIHRDTPEPEHLAKMTEPAPNPQATELVGKIRADIIALFAEHGAASNQIGKAYPYFQSMQPGAAALVLALKQTLDPHNLMNPGALQLPTNADQQSDAIRSKLANS